MGESFDPLLSSAVRATANFPFGFPLVELETRRPLFLHPNWTQRCKEPDWEVGQYLHRTMLDLLVAKYGNGIAVTQIDPDPEKTNIHTTWAFDPGTREELKGIFEDQWSKRNKSLIDKWKYLCERARSVTLQDFGIPSGLQLIDRERPPMD